jgi:hypothetical protein
MGVWVQIPVAAFLFNKMVTDIIDFILENPNSIPYEISPLHTHTLEEYCVVKRNMLISLGGLPDKLESIASEVEYYKRNKDKLKKEVSELTIRYLRSIV